MDTTAILSTAHEEGTGAYMILEYLLRAWSGPREELLIVTPRASRVFRAATELGFPVIQLATPRDALVHNFAAMNGLLSTMSRCRRVHAWHSRGMELALFAGHRLRIETTVTMHDHPRAYAHGVIRRAIMRVAGNRLDRFACVSDAVRREWAGLVDRPRLDVVYNGVTGITPAQPPPGRPLTAGFLGMHTRMKGFGEVEKWIADPRLAGLTWNLYGNVDPALASSAASLIRTHAPRVALRGQQSPATIFGEIDLLVHPSQEFDSLPTALLEAAAAGVPAVASDIGGAREIIADGETGYLFDLGDSGAAARHLEHLIVDADLRGRLGRAARAQFENRFQASRMAANYRAFWKLDPAR